MKRVFENIKSFVLTILIILSLFLTGSLWFDNYQGLSLLTSVFHDNVISKFNFENDNSIEYDKIIVPYKVTVINPDKNRWIFYETDSMNLVAWDIVKKRLNSIDSETEIITGKVKEWDKLFTRKSVVLDFGGVVEYDILRLVIPNLPSDNLAFVDVEKMAITKSVEGNEIYLLQNNNNKKALYKVLLKGEDAEIETYMGNCENVKTGVRYVELPKVGTTVFYDNKEVISESDILFPLSKASNRRAPIKSLQASTHFKMEDEYSINRFVISVFNNTDFVKFVTNDGSNIFINDDKSSIKFEKNGIVEYINNSKLSGETTSASRNLNVAMNFIRDIQVYDNIYLVSAREDDGTYTFKFSFATNGVIAGFEQPIIDEDRYSIIEIKVREDSIRYFKGKLLDLKLSDKEEYISNFTHNILDKVLDKVLSNTKTNISSVEMMYNLDKVGTSYPNWVVKYSEKKSNDENIALISVVKK